MSTINYVAHGLSAGQSFRFANVIPDDCGIDESQVYYVLTSGLTADSFKFSEEQEGTEFVLDLDIEDGSVVALDTYVEQDADDVSVSHAVEPIRDTTPPDIPTGLITQGDVNGVFVKWSNSTARDLAFYELRYAPDDGTGLAPDTDNWTTVRMKTTTAFIGGLTADENGDGTADSRYWFQVRAVDTTGNVAPWAGTGTASAATNVITMDATHKFLEDDKVRMTGLVGGSGLVEGTDYYVIASGLTTTALKVSLTLGGSEVNITVDYTDLNVVGYPTYRDFQAESETGFTLSVSGDPQMVGSGEIEYASIGTEHIKVTGLAADVIKTGTLKINTTDANMADGIKIYDDDGATLLGLWNEDGIFVYANSDPLDYVQITNAGITVYSHGVSVASLSPDGVNASALTFGALPGGHNIILNSSFELAAFGAGATAVPFTSTADFSDTGNYELVSQTNISTSNNLTQTGVAF